MTLYEKIVLLYPELEQTSLPSQGIILQNDADGRGDYIAKWEHPTLTQPTQEDLDGISS